MPAPIIGIGLRVQFGNWGFEHIEQVRDIEKAIKSVRKLSPSLVVLDADWSDTELTFSLIQQVRRNCHHIPVIFISQLPIPSLAWQAQLQWLEPNKWLSKPPHTEDLWQAVVSLLPTIGSSSQQG